MRISQRKIQHFRNHFSKEVVFYCGAFGVKPDDFEFRMTVTKGVLSICILLDDDFSYVEHVRVGYMQPRFQQHLLASFKSEVNRTFSNRAQPLVVAA
jgi:hypothetical protein